MANLALLARAAGVLTDENTRKTVGWTVSAILSPLILVIVFFCALGSATSEHNISAVELCFNGGTLPESIPAEYRVCIEQMRERFAQLDSTVSAINGQIEGETSLDDIRVKAIFYALYFGAENLPEDQKFVDCFVTYEERTRTITTEDENGDPVESEESYTVAIPIVDIAQVYKNIRTSLAVEVTAEHQGNADSIYSLIRYGAVSGDISFAGSDVPFIGADGFCSPVGGNWRNIVTSEFGYRRDPFTGESRGHTGIDLAIPKGTPIRAALPGKVTVSKYNAGGYGYYVRIDHGGGLETLYGHNSQLLAKVGQTVQAGDIISLSGSTGRSTGPHLHFEVRINGQKVNPRGYLP